MNASKSCQYDLSGSSLLLVANPLLSFCVAALVKTIPLLELASDPIFGIVINFQYGANL